MKQLQARWLLVGILLIQVITHTLWLSPSAHSGQLAIPWMMNQGRVLFDNLLEQHAPGSSLLGALAQQLLPFEPIDTLRFLNLVLVLSLTCLIYFVANKLANNNSLAGLLASLVWFWWEPVYGNVMLYFDTLMAFFILLAVAWFIVDTKRTRKMIVVGLFMGTATLFKQHAWAVVGLFGVWLLVFQRDRRIIVYGVSALIAPILTILVIVLQGNLDSYLYWNWTFNLSGLMDGVPLDGDFFRKLWLTNALVPVFALLTVRENQQREMNSLLLILWLGACVVLYPRFGEVHAMAHLPFISTISGIVLFRIVSMVEQPHKWFKSAPIAEVALSGVMIALGIGWLWTGLVAYVPNPVGLGRNPAYHEYESLVAEIRPQIDEGDTLFALPETDSTPQLHLMTDMLPPNTWIKGWHWYFKPPIVLDTLLDEWEANPPTFIIVFPDLVSVGQPGIQTLIDTVDSRYEIIDEYEAIPFHGDAIVYKLK